MGRTQQYESAYDDALSALQRSATALGTYHGTGAQLPEGLKLEGDLNQLAIDLGNLDAGLRARSNPFDEWNQLTDYAAGAAEVARMPCA